MEAVLLRNRTLINICPIACLFVILDVQLSSPYNTVPSLPTVNHPLIGKKTLSEKVFVV